MDTKDLVGQYVKNKKKEVGKIIECNGGHITVDFGERKADFQYPKAFGDGFLIADDAKLQSQLENEAAAYNDRMKKESETRLTNIQMASQKTSEHNKNRKQENIWIKFEGDQDSRRVANIHSVIQDGGTWYVLHFKKKPTGIKEGARFFLSEGIIDKMGNHRQVITARGHLYGFNDENYSPEEWKDKYPWIPSHPWYVVIKDFEALDNQILYGLPLEEVIIRIGSETYDSTSNMDKDYEELMRIHARRSHMRITKEAEAYIDERLDKIFDIYGSSKGVSEYS